jgi:hypothetical protein
MNILAINPNLPTLLKKKYGYRLAILPFFLMLGSPVLLYISLQLYRQHYGIAENVPTKDLHIFEFALKALIVQMIFSYALGWLANGLIARFIFRWSAVEVKKVFLHSKVPNHWYKQENETFEKSRLASLINWGETRKKGKLRFIIKVNLIGFCFALLIKLLKTVEASGIQSIDWNVSVWLLILLSSIYTGVAAIIWVSIEKEYLEKLECD